MEQQVAHAELPPKSAVHLAAWAQRLMAAQPRMAAASE